MAGLFKAMKRNPVMCRHLKIALMAVFATSFALHQPQACAGISSSDGPGTIQATKEGGRVVFTNEAPSNRPRAAVADPSPHRKLMYWSTTDKRWKPVPSANTASMKAARDAADEVTRDLGRESAQLANARVVAANAGGRQASAADIEASIVLAAARHNVDPNLVRAVVKVESNFNPNAVSRKGAIGLMQLMPSTARQLNVKNPFDPEQNVDAGVRHLKQLLESYGGDVQLTLAAYNAGAGAVTRSAGVPHYAETQNYVKRITNLYYGGADLSPSAALFMRAPVRVQRDSRGVLYISNTE
jgi:soluble lytic murein transglycosylase-like protein